MVELYPPLFLGLHVHSRKLSAAFRAEIPTGYAPFDAAFRACALDKGQMLQLFSHDANRVVLLDYMVKLEQEGLGNPDHWRQRHSPFRSGRDGG